MQFVCFFSNICREFEVLISQGSVATYLRWGGYCHLSFVANFIRFPAVQTFWKLVKIWQSYRQLKGGNFFETQCRMWANAKRDGHPAQYRWCPLFNATKFGWRPLLECRLVTLPKVPRLETVEICLVLETRQQISAASGPKVTILWRHVRETLTFNNFFPIIDTCPSCKDIAQQSAMVTRWRIFGNF